MALLEHIEISLVVMEHFIPQYFYNATYNFNQKISSKTRNTNVHEKMARSKENIKEACNRFWVECVLYEFLAQRLLRQYKQVTIEQETDNYL